MATPAVPVSTATPAIHPSWWARAATWFGHAAKSVKNAVLKVVGMSDSVAAEVKKIEPTLGAISDLVLPGSSLWEGHLIDVWSAVAAAVHTAGDAAAANGVNVSIDATLASQVKAIIPSVQGFLHPAASSAPAATSPTA